MKNWKKRLTSKTFWLSLIGSVVVVLQCFGVKVDVPFVNEAVTALCSVFIVLGIMKNDYDADGNGIADELPTIEPNVDEIELGGDENCETEQSNTETDE